MSQPKSSTIKSIGLTYQYVPSPAQTILRSWDAYEKQDAKIEWSRGLPESWIEDCVTDGIVPFLQSRGYVLKCTPQECSHNLRQWAFAHVWTSRLGHTDLHINYVHPYPGTQEDYDFFCMKVNAFDCTELMDTWVSSDFFDESPAGRAQRMEFQTFLWRSVDLDRSKTHRRWRETHTDEDQEENTYMHSLQEEGSGAYGGDRRTY